MPHPSRFPCANYPLQPFMTPHPWYTPSLNSPQQIIYPFAYQMPQPWRMPFLTSPSNIFPPSFDMIYTQPLISFMSVSGCLVLRINVIPSAALPSTAQLSPFLVMMLSFKILWRVIMMEGVILSVEGTPDLLGPLCYPPILYYVISSIQFLLEGISMTHKVIREDAQQIKAQLTQELLPRTFKYSQLQNKKLIPQTTETRVVVECLKKTFGFKINQYRFHQKILNGVISEQRFNSFVRRANQVIENEMLTKENKENEPFFTIIQLLLKISILIASLAFILLAIIVYDNTQSYQNAATVMRYVSEVLICFTGIIAGLCPIFLYRAQYKPLNHQRIIQEKLHDLAYEQNKLNEHLNCRWSVAKNFFWLQLNIDRALILERQLMGSRESHKQHSEESDLPNV